MRQLCLFPARSRIPKAGAVPPLTWDALAVRVRVPAGGAGGAGRAVVHPAQQGAQVAHRDLLDEGGAVLAEVPPLEDLQGTHAVRAAGPARCSARCSAPTPARSSARSRPSAAARQARRQLRPPAASSPRSRGRHLSASCLLEHTDMLNVTQV